MRTLLAVVAASLALAPSGSASSSARTVAYSAYHGVWIRSVGGPPHRIRRGAGFGELAASPDGRWLAYSHSGPDGVYVMDARGTQWWRVRRADGVPVWSPDGRRIAIATASGIDVVARDGSGAHRVIRGGGCEAAWAGSDVIAACGRRLLEVSPTGRVRLLDDPKRDGRVRYPSGSSDGAVVAFGRRCNEAPFGGDVYCEIAGVRPGDGSRRTLVPYDRGAWAGAELAPLWIPGTHRLLVSLFGFANEIDEVDADTGARWVVHRPGGLLLGATPDGSFVVQDGRWAVFCDPDGGVRARVDVGREARSVAPLSFSR
jgi:hypothetical protein